MSSGQSWRHLSWAPLAFLISGLSDGMIVFLRKGFFLLGRWLEILLLRWKLFAGAPLDRMCVWLLRYVFAGAPLDINVCGYSDKFSQVSHWIATCVVTLMLDYFNSLSEHGTLLY